MEAKLQKKDAIIAEISAEAKSHSESAKTNYARGAEH